MRADYNLPPGAPFKVANYLNGVGPDPCANASLATPSSSSSATGTSGVSASAPATGDGSQNRPIDMFMLVLAGIGAMLAWPL